MLRDTQNNPLPADLVVLTDRVEELSYSERNAVVNLNWFQPTPEMRAQFGNVILVSLAALRRCVRGAIKSPDYVDAGLGQMTVVERISDVLHRCSDHQFYIAPQS